MKIKGLSMFSNTTHKNTKGKYPTNAYGVGLTDIEIIDGKDTETYIVDRLYKERTVKIDNEEKNIPILKIQNSKFEIPMFDMNNEQLEQAVPIKNGTPITIDVSVRHSNTYNVDYLVVNAIRVDEPIKKFNPFAESED